MTQEMLAEAKEYRIAEAMAAHARGCEPRPRVGILSGSMADVRLFR